MRAIHPALAAALLACAFARAEAPREDALMAYAATLRAKFPDVATLSTAELAGFAPAERPILLDARTEKEFAVSRIAGARRAEADAVGQLERLGAGREDLVVVYCSVGARSALLARRLGQAGFTRVRNLEGSLFAWANEGRPLVNARGPASGVHPFNAQWGRYLDRSLWRWTPEPAPSP
jgi:rhodanese-related sulfurtransferase